MAYDNSETKTGETFQIPAPEGLDLKQGETLTVEKIEGGMVTLRCDYGEDKETEKESFGRDMMKEMSPRNEETEGAM